MSIGGFLDSVTRTGPETSLTTSALLDIIKSERRRDTIHLLATINDPISLRDLSELLAEHEHGDYSSNQRKAAYTALYQTHLPKLATNDIIEFNSNRAIITPGPELPAVADILVTINHATADESGGDHA